MLCNIAFLLKLGGLRAKLQAEHGNAIDTVFIDRRNNTAYPNGNSLVRSFIYI